MKLITEHVDDVKLVIQESKTSKDKKYFIEGIFLQTNKTNRNNRMYMKETLEKEVKRYNEEYVLKNRAFGELGHPDTPSINLDRVSHMIKDLRLEGDDFIGKAEIINTPFGNIVKSLIDAGAQLGVSSRGLGSIVEKNGVNVVQDDFILATAADIVADPSAPNAFVQGIVEGAEWVYNVSTKSWVMAEKLNKAIKSMTAKQISENQARMFETFLTSLK